MINPFLNNDKWAMHKPNLMALAEQAKAFEIDPDDDGDNDTDTDSTPYQVVNGVAVMSITGPMVKYNDIFTALFGGTSTLNAKQNFQDALDDPTVNATLIVVDSPGGMVSGTGDLAEAISNSTKPVWVYVSDMCASAAYWVASQADKVFCNASGWVGSIGAYSVMQDTSAAYAKEGIKNILVKAGSLKGAGFDGVPITDAQVANEQREIDAVYAMFLNAVSAGRSLSDDEALNLGTGQVWIAAEAQQLGLIDGIASIDECYAMLLGEMTMAKPKTFNVGKNAIASAKAEMPVEDNKAVAEDLVKDITVSEVKVEDAPAEVIEVKTEEVKAEDKKSLVEVEQATFEKMVADSLAFKDALKLAETKGFDEGVKYEQSRLASIEEIASEDPAFVISQFKSGAEKGSAAQAYNKLLIAQLKEARAAVGKESGAKAVALAPVEKRDTEKKGSFISIRR